MPNDWGDKPDCAPRQERKPPHPQDEFNDNGTDDGICPACDATGERHGRACKRCGGKGYIS